MRRRTATLLVMAVALAACGDRRDFDQRYNDTSGELARQAHDLDANLASDNLADGANQTDQR